MAATATLLLSTGATADDKPHLFAIDKKTGRRIGKVETPQEGEYGIMTYMHGGKQYIVVAAGGNVQIDAKRGNIAFKTDRLVADYEETGEESGGSGTNVTFLEATGAVVPRLGEYQDASGLSEITSAASPRRSRRRSSSRASPQAGSTSSPSWAASTDGRCSPSR